MTGVTGTGGNGTGNGWSVRGITLVLYPFGAGAMAVNAFFASLIGSWIGLPVLSTAASCIAGALIGLPATWAFARHIRRLMDEASDHG
jgi:sensor histidine kinase regulating citrate/malate metabolism